MCKPNPPTHAGIDRATLIWHTLIIALIYFITGRIGQLVGIPPGNVTLIWPPSGVALVILLSRGNYSLVGIWLGALIANTWAFWDGSSIQTIIASLAVGSMIGLGSALQPVVGRWLLGSVEYPRALFSTSRRIFRFLGIVPVMCLVSSTIGVLSLCVGGYAPFQDFWELWHTWWIGDGIGVLVVVPAVTYWLVEIGRLTLKEKLISISPIALTIALTVMGFFTLKDNELLAINSRFQQEANKGVTLIDGAIREQMKHIDTLGGMVAVIGETISREQFQTYSRVVIHQSPSLQAMEWVPIVPHEQRGSFEEQAREQWRQHFEITELRNDVMVSAGIREHYMPVYLIEPLAGNEKALGFDLYSHPTRRQTLDSSIYSDIKLQSPPIVLVQERESSYGFLYVVPVYRTRDINRTWETSSGVALGVFRVDTLVDYLRHTLGELGISSRIIDQGRIDGKGDEQKVHIYENLAAGSSWDEEPSLLEHSETIAIGGRHWTFHFRGGDSFFTDDSFILPKVTLAGGLLFSVLLSFLLIVFRSRAEAEHRRHSKELEHLATTDPLTGLYNRRCFLEHLQDCQKLANRYGAPCALLMFDLDHFKSINDQHGHNIGDKVLRITAERSRGLLRDVDIMGRWGGEEFMVLAPQTDLDGAVQLAERLRESLANAPIDPVGTVTASFGVVCDTKCDSLEELTHRVDEALYAAKLAGRNCVRCVPVGKDEE